MQELNQVFKPQTQATAERPLTATEELERDWMGCPGDVKSVEWYRNERKMTDEEILSFLKSFA